MNNVAFGSYINALRNAGVHLGDNMQALTPAMRQDYRFAMDAAQPGLVSTPNSAIPSVLTTFVDPETLRILTAPNAAADILGEVRKGDWTTQTAIFKVAEYAGDVSNYGDFSGTGRVTVNTAFPEHQNHIYQTTLQYGDREMEIEGLAKLNWAEEQKNSAIQILNKYQNNIR